MPGLPLSDTSFPPPSDPYQAVGDPGEGFLWPPVSDDSADVGDPGDGSNFPAPEDDIVEPDDFPSQENERATPDAAPLYDFQRKNNQVVRYFEWPWDELVAYAQDYMGYATWDGTTFNRYLPYLDYQLRTTYGTPPIPTGAIATRVEVLGWGYRGGDFTTQAPLTSSNKYRYGKVRVTLSTVPFPVGELADPSGRSGQLAAPIIASETERYCYKEVRQGKEAYGRRTGGYVWANAPTGNILNFPVPIYASFDDVAVTWYDLPRTAVPYAAIQRCQSKVNLTPLTLPVFPPPSVYESETLLLLTYATELTYFPDATPACNLTYFFKRRYFPLTVGDPYSTPAGSMVGGWNHELQSNGVAQRRWRKDALGSGPPNYTGALGPYIATDFTNLFVPGGA